MCIMIHIIGIHIIFFFLTIKDQTPSFQLFVNGKGKQPLTLGIPVLERGRRHCKRALPNLSQVPVVLLCVTMCETLTLRSF